MVAFPLFLTFPLKDTSTQPTFNSPKKEVVPDPAQETQRLKDLFTKKKKCFTPLTRAWHIFIKEFEFYPGLVLSRFMHEKKLDISWDDLLGNEIFTVRQPSTYLNLWISQVALCLFVWVGNMPFCFCF